jgi:hypothetical protein
MYNLILKKMRKQQRTGETIGTVIEIPKELSLKLSRLIIDKAEKGLQITKPELIVKYIEKGIEAENDSKDERVK